ncbi:MAG TPA: hypothetical protein VGH30_12705 [Jatrophihabitantaceae bacterium]|jgi:hypothetical protein
MDIEFITTDFADDEPAPAPTPRRRRWWPAAVAAVTAGVLLWSVTRPDTPSRKPIHHAAPVVAAKPVPQCVGVPDCAVRDNIPASVERLVRAYLPARSKLQVKTVVAVNSLTLTDLLVERDIDVVHDSVTVLIRVQRGVDGTSEIVHAPPGVGSLLLHHNSSGYVVRLQYLAPETVPPMLDRLRELTRDPRLESL